jgi:hypothetical protein
MLPKVEGIEYIESTKVIGSGAESGLFRYEEQMAKPRVRPESLDKLIHPRRKATGVVPPSSLRVCVSCVLCRDDFAFPPCFGTIAASVNAFPQAGRPHERQGALQELSQTAFPSRALDARRTCACDGGIRVLFSSSGH